MYSDLLFDSLSKVCTYVHPGMPHFMGTSVAATVYCRDISSRDCGILYLITSDPSVKSTTELYTTG